MIRVCIADDNMDSHELIDDLIEINFRDVTIEHALTKETFLDKIGPDPGHFNLILYNCDLDREGEPGIVDLVRMQFPEILSHMVFITSDIAPDAVADSGCAVLTRPFSLDYFGEVVQKACG